MNPSFFRLTAGATTRAYLIVAAQAAMTERIANAACCSKPVTEGLSGLRRLMGNQDLIYNTSVLAAKNLHAIVLRHMCILILTKTNAPIMAVKIKKLEQIIRGAQKIVTLKSGRVIFTEKAGHTVSAAEIFISSK